MEVTAQTASQLGTLRPSTQGVSPVFDGWYRNPDGSFTLSFGYYSRSSDSAVDIPLGPENRIEPIEYHGGQPTHFLPRPRDRGPGRGIRYWGVFTIAVPREFGSERVVWTLRGGDTVHSVTGHIEDPRYELDALGVAHTGAHPPTIHIDRTSDGGRGPGGVSGRGPDAEVDLPLELQVLVTEVGSPPASVQWFKHQGPGDVVFSDRGVGASDVPGRASISATFSSPGRYVLRARATDQSTEFDRFCCWTNGYLTVDVRAGVEEAEKDTLSSVAAEPTVTYSESVAPILRQKCESCHSPGAVAPMSLRTYAEVRPWAPLIREAVLTRTMPPWHVDPKVGIQDFEPDPSLTAEEVATVVAWVDGGAREGDRRLLPAPPLHTDHAHWQLARDLGPPDLTVRSPPFTVPASGEDKWVESVVNTDLAGDRWIRAIEVRPSSLSGSRVAHHVSLFVHARDRTEFLWEWAMGKGGEIMPSATGRLMPGQSSIGWEIHYSPSGEVAQDQRAELALWFYPEGQDPDYVSRLELFRADPTNDVARGASLDIPPGEVRTIQGAHVLSSAARIESFQPHMHLRGVAMSMEAILPDGDHRVLSHVDRFQHNWQISYRYAERSMPLLPEGTVLLFTAWHDNRAANPSNPDPTQWVGFGRRTVDEMAHAWVGITYLTDEQLEALVSQQRALRR